MSNKMPTRVEDIIALLRQVAAGMRNNSKLWINAPFTDADIDAIADALEIATQDQATQKAIAEQTTSTKNTQKKLAASTLSRLKSWAESIVGKDDPRLNELGFGAPSMPKPLEKPGQPQALESRNEKIDGELELLWKKPAKGGAPATYKIYRTEEENAKPVLVDAVRGAQLSVKLTNQPVGVVLRYYIVAQNNAGESRPSNTIEVKL